MKESETFKVFKRAMRLIEQGKYAEAVQIMDAFVDGREQEEAQSRLEVLLKNHSKNRAAKELKRRIENHSIKGREREARIYARALEILEGWNKPHQTAISITCSSASCMTEDSSLIRSNSSGV